MAQVIEDTKRVSVSLTQGELNALLVTPAKERGFIDFNPTRISTKPDGGGNFVITFERTENANKE